MVIGLTASAFVAALLPGPIASAEPVPLIATAEWNDSTIQYAGEYLQPCDRTTMTTCIENAWITRDGQKVTGTPVIDTGFNWIYEFETAGRMETYWLAMTKGQDPTPDDPNRGSFVSLYLVPVDVKSTSNWSDDCSGGIWTPDTAWCPIEHDDSMRFGVTIRSPLRASGWIDARMDEPSVGVTAPSAGKPGRFTVEGSPIRIPTLKTTFSYDDPIDREEWLKVVAIGSGDNGDSWGTMPPDWEACRPQVSCWAPFPALTPYGFAALSKALPERLKRATGWIIVWRASTVLLSPDAEVDSECVGEFSGLTSSNAMTYKQYVTVDDFTRQVTFTMAGPTYDADGKRLTGDFSMVMTEKAAQCQWGTFDVSDQFIIQVTSEDGVEAAATASVSRRDGQIIVRATGFGFSLKQVALTQVSKGAPASPKRLKATAKGSTLAVTWASRPATKYRLRITTGEGTSQRTVRRANVSKGRVTFPGMAKGTYRLELVAFNARGQSPPTATSATIR